MSSFRHRTSRKKRISWRQSRGEWQERSGV